MCASEIKRILENNEIAVNLSNKAYNSKLARQNNRAVKEQIRIYRDLLDR